MNQPVADAEPAPPDGGIDHRHLILISTASPAACFEAVSSALAQVGGQVRAFSLKPVGRRYEAVLRLSGVDDAAAERAAGLIHGWPEAGSAAASSTPDSRSTAS